MLEIHEIECATQRKETYECPLLVYYGTLVDQTLGSGDFEADAMCQTCLTPPF